MVKGVLYATAGTRRSIVALDAKTGELMWAFSMREGNRAAIAPRQLSGRGLSYWTDGRGDERILFVTTGYRLVALNARTGALVSTFGKNGVVDLKEGVVYGSRQPIDLETGEIGLHSTPTVAGDVVLVGSSFKEGFTVVTHNNSKGLARAFDVRTGKTLWTFLTIPRPVKSAAKPGKTIRGRSMATPACGRKSLPIRKRVSHICRLNRRRRTSMAVTGRATICLARASSPWI
jgi:quinoprotein glucose dehydrogenase